MKTPPCMPGNWLVGVGPRLQKDPLKLEREAYEKYGDVVRLPVLPWYHVYLITHPDGIEHVLLKNHKNYRKPSVLAKPFRRMAGNGLFISEGDFWLRQRRLMQPAFHRNALAAIAPKIVTGAEACVVRWQSATTRQPIDMLDAMMRLTLRIAGETLFSTDVSRDADEFGSALRHAFKHISHLMNAPIVPPAWLPTSANLKFKRAKDLIDRTVLDIIAERRQATNQPNDLLGLLLAAQDEETGAGMSDQQLLDEALTLFIAGHDTVGAALSWTWYLLCRHPQVQEQVHEEVRSALRGRAPTLDDLQRLPLTRAVFEESMRLYPPAWGLAREPLADDVISGFAIPKKSILIIGIHVTHRRADLWEAPDEFRPERFLGDAAETRHRFAYLPFGGGPRVCIGQAFALLEGPLVLATLAQQFRVELAPHQMIRPDPTFTLRPAPAVNVTLHRRA